MKNLLLILTIVFLFQLSSCKDEQTKPKQQTIEKIKDTVVIPEVETPKKKGLTKLQFVRAESGLNFRNKPNGKILGKFIYNTRLDIIEHTGVMIEIQDEGQLLRGQWVGVKRSQDTVYVFSGFLTPSKDVTSLVEENERYINIKEFNFEEINLKNGDTVLIGKKPFFELIDIQEINKIEFNKEYPSHKNKLEIRSDIKRKDNLLSIKCPTKTFEFKDAKIVHDEDRIEYYYAGTLNNMNLHLIKESGYEYTEYHFLNYNTCEVVSSIGGYPQFNPNYTKLIVVDTDSYEYSDIGLYDVENEAITLKMNFTLPFLIQGRSFFKEDNYYFESVAEWHDGVQQKISKQYFKMKILMNN